MMARRRVILCAVAFPVSIAFVLLMLSWWVWCIVQQHLQAIEKLDEPLEM